MELENATQTALGWNFPQKQGKQKLARIPIDSSVYSKSKDGYVLAHDSQYENPLFINEYLKKDKQKGWSYTNNTDLDGDGYNDTVIYNADKHHL